MAKSSNQQPEQPTQDTSPAKPQQLDPSVQTPVVDPIQPEPAPEPVKVTKKNSEDVIPTVRALDVNDLPANTEFELAPTLTKVEE
jgi:hypothetical protein